MAQNIRLKRSAVPGRVPDVNQVELGELALNTFDGKLYLKKDNGTESIVDVGFSASYALSASFASTASSVNKLNQNVSISGSLTVTGSTNFAGTLSTNTDILIFTGSLLTSGSIISTGSLNILGGVTGSLLGTASYAAFANTSSYAATASSANDFLVRGTLTAQTIVAQVITSSTEFITGSTKFGSLLSNNHQFTGSVSVTGSLTINGENLTGISSSLSSRITTNSASISSLSASFNSFSGSFSSGSFSGSFFGNGSGLTDISASSIVGLDLSKIASGSVTASISPNTGFKINTNTSVSGSLNVSQSINAYNINVGNPTSNAWQSSLTGSYFNNFTSNTDVSEILRFVAGLLSASAPDASPNTKTFSSYTANAQNTTTGTVTAGSVPSGSTNTTVTYLQSRGFANSGSTIFSSITPIYTLGTYGYTYTSVAAGSTIVSSSADAQLFGLGQLSSGTPTSFNVSGSFTFRFKNNSTKTDTATSSSTALITQTGAGTTSGVSLAKINTANPAVIPAAYQDGKFASVFSPSLYSGSATAVSSSGYYHISTSISIASGSSGYTTPITSNAEIFYAPLTTISTNVPANTITASGSYASLTVVSRSLSGAPYLSGSTYNVSSSVTGAFNPLYHAGVNLAYQSLSGTGVTQTSGVTTVSTLGGTIQTANAVYDSTGVTLRAVSTIPFESDSVKTNGLYTFGAANITNIGQTSFTPTTFTVTTNANNKNSSASTYDTETIPYHIAGTFGQPVASGSLAYYTRTQGADASTITAESFTGENYRIVLADNVLAFNGAAWTTTFGLYNLGATDLQVKPGYLVKPGGTYAYWLTNPSAASDYKYYIRKFTTDSTTKTSMTLNLGQVLTAWDTVASNSVSAVILFESSNNTIYTPARVYDPTKTISNFVSNITANTDGQNPFGSQIALYGNTGGSVASTTYTIPVRNADGMSLNSTYNDIYVIVKYKGDPTPVSNITVAFS